MKKVSALLIAAALALSFAACGGSDKNAPSEPAPENTAAEAPQNSEEQSASLIGTGTETGGGEASSASTDPPTDEAPDDAALCEAERAKLVGEWHLDGLDAIQLVFNEDGTGFYNQMTEKNISFTFLVSVSHKTFNNGAPYDDYMLKLSYDTGDVEDVIFFFNDDTGNLVFHNSDNGGYCGVIDYDEWTK